MTEVQKRNNDVLWAVSDYLTMAPRSINAKLLQEINPDGELTEEMAYMALLAGFCGIEDDSLINDYFQWMVRRREVGEYLYNPYYRNVVFPEVAEGGWTLRKDAYEPYEMFPCGDIVLLDDGREIPQMGYFTERFEFPVILQDGREWMALKPNEVETMREPLMMVHGKVAVFGLGLGYFAYMASLKPDISQVVVIERDASVIKLFTDHLLPQFPQASKIRIVESDAFEYMSGPMAAEHFDSAFVDLWHDSGDGAQLYVRAKKLELPGIEYHYWIEETLRSALRFFIADLETK